MSPSSLTYWTPCSRARRSIGSSFSASDSDWFSGWRKSALPSSETFASSARTSRSGVTIRGLISASVASSVTHTSYSATQRVADLLDDVRVGAARGGDRDGLLAGEAGQRVHVVADQALGVALGDLFDVHAAFGAEHHERLLGRAVEQHRRVVLGGDVRGVLDPHRVDGVAADVHPEDVPGVLAQLRLVGGELDPAGLAAAADQHLCLDHDGVADLGRRCHRVLDVLDSSAGGDLQAVAREQLLALVLKQVHLRRGTLTQSAGSRALRPKVRGFPAERGIMPALMPIPKNVTFVTFDVYGTLIDWETGIYEAFAKEAERGRRGARPQRPDPDVPRDRAGNRGRAPTSSTPRCCGARPSRSPNGSTGTSSPRGRASCRTRCSAGRPFRETNPQLAKLAKKYKLGPALEHRRQAAGADPPPHPHRLRPRRDRPAGALLQARAGPLHRVRAAHRRQARLGPRGGQPLPRRRAVHQSSACR